MKWVSIEDGNRPDINQDIFIAFYLEGVRQYADGHFTGRDWIIAGLDWGGAVEVTHYAVIESPDD